MTASGSTPRAHQLGQHSRRRCRAGRPRSPASRPLGVGDQRERFVERVGAARRDSASRGASRCASGRHSIASIEAPAIVAASGCAPPMPPRPAVRIHLPAQVAAEVLAAHLGERLVGALHDALGADVDPASRPSSGRTSSGPCGRARGSAPTWPSAAPGSSWRSARAAHPRACGTRRPACPTAPAASRRRRARAGSARCGRKHSQSRAARPMPPYTTSSSGRSATSGSRLFISIRSGASVSQLRALKRAARRADRAPLGPVAVQVVHGRLISSRPTTGVPPQRRRILIPLASLAHDARTPHAEDPEHGRQRPRPEDGRERSLSRRHDHRPQGGYDPSDDAGQAGRLDRSGTRRRSTWARPRS